ncbi:hypothetical protein QSJ19_14480 [Gordonia sp. ABSL11-1]|uniref:hypothetical protein n=1 Tax=Gordonia sp. ABSL11-1 TaxID=3053924 RepID=UPI002573BAEE|nr:hypothetical protein [Gordonia sp. ABSL11-1]MDL9946773.1 hypothetical protein [Gordonia sp. ABSL11-1]
MSLQNIEILGGARCANAGAPAKGIAKPVCAGSAAGPAAATGRAASDIRPVGTTAAIATAR